MEKISGGRGQETNIARGKAECYIRLDITPECYFFPYCMSGGALTGLFIMPEGVECNGSEWQRIVVTCQLVGLHF